MLTNVIVRRNYANLQIPIVQRIVRRKGYRLREKQLNKNLVYSFNIPNESKSNYLYKEKVWLQNNLKLITTTHLKLITTTPTKIINIDTYFEI